MLVFVQFGADFLWLGAAVCAAVWCYFLCSLVTFLELFLCSLVMFLELCFVQFGADFW